MKSFCSSSVIPKTQLLVFYLVFFFLSGCASSINDVTEKKDNDKHKVEDIFKHDNLVEKDESGVDFIIVSNNNDYLVSLDFEENFSVINLIDGSTFSVPQTEVELADNPDLFRYTSKNEENSLIIQLHKTNCISDFSRKMDYEVAVDFTDSSVEGTKTFYGCGEYVPDYSLHKTWSIVEFYGELLAQEDFVKDFPVLEFNLATRAVYGTDGCNQVSAGIVIEHEKIGFTGFAGTRMACVIMEKGDQIMTAMSNTMFDYELDEGVLTLYLNDEEIVVLKAVE